MEIIKILNSDKLTEKIEKLRIVSICLSIRIWQENESDVYIITHYSDKLIHR